jgi:hypothetical protein
MIHAGGIPALTDGERQADEDNPRGYFEHEGATRLLEDRAWLDGAEGRVVKVVAQLLPALPRDRHYRVCFIERDLDEILRSQALMLQHLGREAARLDEAALRTTFETQLRRVKVWLARQPNLHVLYLRHRRVIDDPAAAAARLAVFLGAGFDRSAAADAVDPGLYRQRAGGRAPVNSGGTIG